MSESLSRRAFLGTTTAAGVILAGQLHRTTAMAAETAEEDKDWPPKLPPVKIHKVFVGRTGGIYCSRPKEEITRFNERLGKLEGRLGNVKFVGGEVIPPANAAKVAANLKDADAVLLFHLSGIGANAPMGQIIDTGLPAAVFSQPFSGHGWMYFPAWRKAGKKVVLLPTSDWGEIDKVVGLMRVPAMLRRTRIIVVRGPVGTVDACNAKLVKERMGAEIVPISVKQIMELHQAVDPKAAEAEAEKYWIKQAKKIVEPSKEDIINSARLYLAMKGLMIKEKAQAITSSACMGAPAKCCLAFSKLNDEGLVGACEGDVDSTLTMLIFRYAFGIPGFISDPVFDIARNALVHFHCTSTSKMDGPGGKRLPFIIRTQSEINKGVSLQVEHRVGQPVTCAKLVNLDTMLISTGKIFKNTNDELACRTQFWTKVPDARKMFLNWGADIIKGGAVALLHRDVFYGDHVQDIRNLGVLMGFKVVEEG